MTKAVFLDTGVLGVITHPRAEDPEPKECNVWLLRMLEGGARICVPEICDYELRREYFRNNSSNALSKLDRFNTAVSYIPIDTRMMVRAAELWAMARRRGRQTADDKELDCDMVLAAQAQVAAQPTEDVIVATTNVGHLQQFVNADSWRNITPD